MNLRTRILIIIGAMCVSLIVILYVVSQSLLLPNFVDLERRITANNIQQMMSILSAEIDDMKAQAIDWAFWDDTYDFIENGNEQYKKANLVDDTFIHLKLNFIVYVHSSGRIVFAKSYDLISGSETPFPQSMKEYISSHESLVKIENERAVLTGIILLPENPLLIVSVPILTSKEEGPPRGTLIMGRYFDSLEIERLSRISLLPITLQPFGDNSSQSDFQEASRFLSKEHPIYVLPLNEDFIAGYALLTDIYGEPAGILRAYSPREIYGEGRVGVNYLLFAVIAVGLEFSILIVFLLERQILSRLNHITKSLKTFSVEDISKARVPVEGSDELTHLAATINGMLSVIQQTESRLRESEARYRSIADNIQDGLIVIENGKAVYFNDRACEIFGYPREELLQKSVDDLLDFPNLPSLTNIRDTMRKPGFPPQELELSIVRKDGTKRFVHNHFSAAPNRESALFIVTTDITIRKQAEEKLRTSEEYFRSLTENALDMVVIMDTLGKVTYVTPSVQRILGFKPEAIIGSNVFGVIHPDDIPAATKIFETGIGVPGFTATLELRIRHQDGSWRQVEARGKNSLSVPAVNGIILNIRDITERKQAEEQLQHLYKLEKELRQKLEDEIDRRVEFLRALVHELKTPLTPVLASSELLIEEIKEATQLRLAKNVFSGAAELNNRIDELLDIAKGEIGMLKLSLQKIAPVEILQEAVENMVPLASAKKLSLVSDLPSSLPSIMADSERLRQVLLNLIGNAIKFTPPGGKITLSAVTEGDNLIVEVQDTGRGIDKEEQKELFQPYHRLTGDRERLSGLGLGLALCKTIVELHGGKIWVVSQKGTGSTFAFSLPINNDDKIADSAGSGAQ